MLQRFQRIRETDMKKLILIITLLINANVWSESKFVYCMSPDKGTLQIKLFELQMCVSSRLKEGYELHGETFQSKEEIPRITFIQALVKND